MLAKSIEYSFKIKLPDRPIIYSGLDGILNRGGGGSGTSYGHPRPDDVIMYSVPEIGQMGYDVAPGTSTFAVFGDSSHGPSVSYGDGGGGTSSSYSSGKKELDKGSGKPTHYKPNFDDMTRFIPAPYQPMEPVRNEVDREDLYKFRPTHIEKKGDFKNGSAEGFHFGVYQAPEHESSGVASEDQRIYTDGSGVFYNLKDDTEIEYKEDAYDGEMRRNKMTSFTDDNSINNEQKEKHAKEAEGNNDEVIMSAMDHQRILGFLSIEKTFDR